MTTTKLTPSTLDLLSAIHNGRVLTLKGPGEHTDPVTGAWSTTEPVWREFWRTDVKKRSTVRMRAQKLIGDGLAKIRVDSEAPDGRYAKGTLVLTEAGRAALGLDDWDPADGVQYSHCRHCGNLISRADHDADWIQSGPAGTTYAECLKAPNAGDGPTPLHQPGKILNPPKPQPQPEMVPDLSVLPRNIIPWIPKTEA